jgi:hypothetical protein
MIEILIEYPFVHDYENIIITMIHGDDPVAQIMFKNHWLVERKFTKTDSKYHKFSTYKLPSMKLYKYGWSRHEHKMAGPVVARAPEGLWKVVIFGTSGSEHDINFDNFGPVWVEMLEDYQQMKIDIKHLNSQNQ